MNAWARAALALFTAAGERLGSLFAELLDGQRQLVGAGAHRVVDVDDLPPRQVVEGPQRHAANAFGVGGVDAFRRGQTRRHAVAGAR